MILYNMVIENDEDCRKLIEKLDQGLPPQLIQEIIIYLEKTKNTEFTLTLVKYLNNQNMQSRNSVWALSSQIAMIGEDVSKIKEHLKIP